jgi:uncharacterized protein YjiS (DUF1127 family)
MENGAMNLLHRIGGELAVLRRPGALKEALGRLSPRALADLGLERADIPAVARLGARLGPEGATLGKGVARVRTAATESRADRLFRLLERMSARTSEIQAYQTRDLDRYVAEAHRLRAETMAAFWRSVSAGLADLVRPLTKEALASGLGRRIQLQMVWRRAYRQMRAELATYSDRELMTDLHLTRSEIDDIAAEGADERLGAYIAADPALRRADLGLRALHRAHG